MAIGRPRERARLRGIARHAHVLAVGDAPAVHGVLLHGGHDEAPVRRPRHVEMRSFPFQRLRRFAAVREPQRRSVVVAQGQPIALRREGEAPHRGADGGRLHLAAARAGPHVAAAGPGQPSGRMKRQRVDPSTLLGADCLARAIRFRRDDAAVVAARDDAMSVGHGRQDRRIRMGIDALRRVRAEQDDAVHPTPGPASLPETRRL